MEKQIIKFDWNDVSDYDIKKMIHTDKNVASRHVTVIINNRQQLSYTREGFRYSIYSKLLYVVICSWPKPTIEMRYYCRALGTQNITIIFRTGVYPIHQTIRYSIVKSRFPNIEHFNRNIFHKIIFINNLLEDLKRVSKIKKELIHNIIK